MTNRQKLVPLGNAFYDRRNVVTVARALLGKVLVTGFDGRVTSGRIVEVEAYNGVIDRASHAWSGRRTQRTEVMYGPGGTVYVYLIYGIHHLFNVVTNAADVPHAVLVRALDPLEGIPVMLERTGKPRLDHSLTRGPGNLSRAMGLLTKHTGASLIQSGASLIQSGTSLIHSGASLIQSGASAAQAGALPTPATTSHLDGLIWIGDDGFRVPRSRIVATPRIGVDYAGEDAALPYRFFVKDNPFVSGPKTSKPVTAGSRGRRHSDR